MNFEEDKAYHLSHHSDDCLVVGTTELKNQSVTQNEACNEAQDGIVSGLCTNCDHRNLCLWKHDNKTTCEHFK